MIHSWCSAHTVESFNLTLMGLTRCWTIKQYLYWLNFACDFFISWWSENVHLSVFSFCYKKTAVLIIIGPVMSFPLEHIAVNHLCNTLSNGWISGFLYYQHPDEMNSTVCSVTWSVNSSYTFAVQCTCSICLIVLHVKDYT